MKAGATLCVSDLELASRLSFFLWSSIPDDELLRIAASGRLDDPAVLEQQTRRMLADSRSSAMIDNLAGQWLMLRQLDDVSPGTKDFDGGLRYAFHRETELLFETIAREDRSILDLIDADYTFVDERLAPLRHPQRPRQPLPPCHAERQRAARELLGRQLPHDDVRQQPHIAGEARQVGAGKPARRAGAAAPPGVETNLRDRGRRTDLGAPAAGRHRASPNCASCHAVMDPVASLEPFDLIGKWRETDGGLAVNATGRLADGTVLDGPPACGSAARPS